MGFKEGVGVLAIMALAFPFIQTMLTAIPGVVDDGAAYFMILSWVVTAFTGKEIQSSTFAAIQSSMQTAKYQQAIKEFQGKYQTTGLESKVK